ncbi:MAG: alpha/beta hydrolase, partial [Anaerolineae bacterium]|nr:alpha/beta hydrolase [Anaerolineae bacterium]
SIHARVSIMVTDRWVENDLVRLHYLDNQEGGPGVPIMFVPGLRSSAENFRPMLQALAPRRALAIDLRGRGESDAPEIGYRFEDQVEDIATVVQQANLPRLCLFGHSIGVTHALGFAIQQPGRVAGLILAGYPAEYPRISADWVMEVMSNHPDALPMHAVLGLQQESESIPMWEDLADLQCPLLVMRGGRPTDRLKAAGVQHYLAYAPQAKVAVFEESGHRVWRPDFERFIRTVNDFLREIDA